MDKVPLRFNFEVNKTEEKTGEEIYEKTGKTAVSSKIAPVRDKTHTGSFQNLKKNSDFSKK